MNCNLYKNERKEKRVKRLSFHVRNNRVSVSRKTHKKVNSESNGSIQVSQNFKTSMQNGAAWKIEGKKVIGGTFRKEEYIVKIHLKMNA